MTVANPQSPQPISTEEYERMGELGILPESGVELIDGKIVKMSPKGDRHAFVVSELNLIFTRHPAINYRVYCDALSLQAFPGTTPDPDIALARLVRSYVNERPRPNEIAIIIEVAGKSYAYDTSTKKAIYAYAGIPEYWVFDIRRGRNIVQCYSQPKDGDYLLKIDKTIGDVIAPIEFPTVAVDISTAFGVNQNPD